MTDEKRERERVRGQNKVCSVIAYKPTTTTKWKVKPVNSSPTLIEMHIDTSTS